VNLRVAVVVRVGAMTILVTVAMDEVPVAVAVPAILVVEFFFFSLGRTYY
jgi:hypothetical protein